MRTQIFKGMFLLLTASLAAPALADDVGNTPPADAIFLPSDVVQKIEARLSQQANDAAKSYRQTLTDLSAQGYKSAGFQCYIVNSRAINYTDENNVNYFIAYDLSCWADFDRREADPGGKFNVDHLQEFRLNGVFFTNFQSFDLNPGSWKKAFDVYPGSGGGNSSSAGG